jgi:hypothetical protein
MVLQIENSQPRVSFSTLISLSSARRLLFALMCKYLKIKNGLTHSENGKN